MSLEDYKSKRDFKSTTEPAGKNQEVSRNRFVIQEHRASSLHYDFRMEMEDEKNSPVVLKSWAVPKNVPMDYGVKHLAIRTEDHPVEYLDFEGIIPEDSYGAGEVKIWDQGKWGLMKGSFEEKMLKFNLFGSRIKGRYVMIKTRGYGKQKKDDNEYWLIWRKEN